MTIISEISAALTEAGIATGGAGLYATITRPGPTTGPEWAPVAGTPEAYQVAVVDTNIKLRDANGILTGQITRALLIEAGIVVPVKGDTITVRGVEHVIDEVQTTAPGGVDLMYRVTLVR